MKRQGRSWIDAGTREALKWASSLAGALTRSPRREVVILMYHRVTGTLPLELDLPFAVFRAQMESLASMGVVVSLDAAVEFLASSTGGESEEPRVVLTFDDAYQDFFTLAFPVLSDLGLPATLYVPTGFIDRPECVPLSVGNLDPRALPPCTWEMLGRIQESPLMTLGSYTHSHPELPGLTDAGIEWEVETALGRFEVELGCMPAHFAYPRGSCDARSEPVVARSHRYLALIEGRAAKRCGFLEQRILRLPVHRRDGMRWFGPKPKGRRDWEERLKTRFKGDPRAEDRPS